MLCAGNCPHVEVVCEQIARWEHKLTQPTEAQARAMVVLGPLGYRHYVLGRLGTLYTILKLMARVSLGEEHDA
jgi:hypothetical protein